MKQEIKDTITMLMLLHGKDTPTSDLIQDLRKSGINLEGVNFIDLALYISKRRGNQ